MKPVSDEGDEKGYVFTDVKPTDRQRQLVYAAVRDIGTGGFSPFNIETALREKGTPVHQSVAKTVLHQDYKQLGLRVIDKTLPTYQTVTRPDGVDKVVRRGKGAEPSLNDSV